MTLLKTSRRELYMPDLTLIPNYIEATRQVSRGELAARQVARWAASDGFMLIGTIVSKRVHYPIPVERQRYGDLKDGFKRKQIPEAQAIGKRALRLGLQADIAILGGLFGNFNSERERHRRC